MSAIPLASSGRANRTQSLNKAVAILNPRRMKDEIDELLPGLVLRAEHRHDDHLHDGKDSQQPSEVRRARRDQHAGALGAHVLRRNRGRPTRGSIPIGRGPRDDREAEPNGEQVKRGG